MSGHSSIDALRRLSPVADVDAAAVFGAAGRDALLADVTHLPFGRARVRPATRRRTRRLVIALALGVVVVAATAATWAILGSPARETTSVECVIAGTDTVIPAVSGDPAYDCAVTWQADLGTIPPPLIAYDNGSGGVTVIPRGEKQQPGWQKLPAGQNVALIQLQASLDDYIGGLNSSCLNADAATDLTEAKLASFGFTGWTVTIRNQGKCTNGDLVDPASKSVTLIASDGVTGAKTAYQNLADKLRPIAKSCESLPDALASVRAAAGDLGLSESARTYRLNAVTDDSLRCASIYETVGGTIFVTVRGPGS
jgi:hypothetical protein